MKTPTSLLFRLTIIFIFFFILFLTPRLLDDHFSSSDDPYYHAKHAFLIEQSGQFNLVKPWLEFHFFNYAPVDPWWGFHLAMALFIHWFGLILGVKIFASLLAALVFLVFYLVLDKLKVKYPLAWTLLLFVSSSIFSFRLFLERPHLLTIIVMPLAFLFLVKGKNIWLFILSLLYALCYDVASLIILLTLIYLAADAYTNRRINLRPLIASAGGILAGILIHPASLNYLFVIFMQLWQILFLRFTGVNLNIGGEAQTIEFFDFIKYNSLALLFYILAASYFLLPKKHGKNSAASIFLFLYSSFWLIVTLLVPRGVEFWLPFVFLFIAVIFNDFIVTEEFKQIKNFLTNKTRFKTICFFLFSALVLASIINLSQVFFILYYNEAGGHSESYRQANNWLKSHTKKDSVIFYDNWGMWPMMFFHNDHNHYIHGIDPTYLYEYDERVYWLWHHISYNGLYCDQPKPCFNLSPREQIKLVPLTIKTVFRAKYAVVVNSKAGSLIKTLDNLRTEVKLVFKNKDLLIYEMK